METKRKIDFKQARDFGGIINVTFEFIRENFKGLALSLLLIVGPAAVLSGVINSLNFLNILGYRSFSWIALSYLMLFLVLQLVVSVTYGYINLYLDSELENITPADVWEEVKKNFGRTFRTLFLGAVWVFLGALVLFLPGVYVAVIFSILFAVRYREDISFSDAFNRCSDLIKGYWWATFGLMIVLGIIQAFLSYILQAPMAISVVLRSLSLWEGDSLFANIIFLITTIISSFAYMFYSISCIGMSFHYYSLVEKKEAVGLLEKIENMQEQA